ncbi:3181_t:CDS:1 [Racocetra persica]|uniref:3181_t:CDS:1 n=1 Tax=Racocetra persica TaxID=160502 RepID=A0ACA9QU98_9GLOM|nr:3181_t:CDS:1 [Racocetra persica]
MCELQDLLILLEPMYHATTMLSSSTYPTQDDLRMIFYALIIHLNNNKDPEINSQHAVASAMKVKFTTYWAHLNKSLTILGLLDPYNKLLIYDVYEREQAINKLYEIYKMYKTTEKNNENKPLSPVTTITKSRYELFYNLNNCRQVNLNQCKIDKYLADPETEAELLLW